MTLETKTNYPNETYLMAGAGAITGGVGASSLLNAKLHNTAKKAVNAFNQSPEICDEFIKKNNALLTKASNSRRGFFGKINKSCEKMTKAGEDKFEAIKKSTAQVVDEYRNKAIKKLRPQLVGDKLQDGVDKLANKNMAKDLCKSFKSAKRVKNGAIILSSTILGALGGFVIKKIKDNALKKEVKGAKDDFKTKITKN